MCAWGMSSSQMGDAALTAGAARGNETGFDLPETAIMNALYPDPVVVEATEVRSVAVAE